MKVSKLSIANFRGIKSATLIFPDHAVLIGDNNTGKSTVLEAIDLVLGPDRLNRRPPVDEHDFHLGKYISPKQPVVDCTDAVREAQVTAAAPTLKQGESTTVGADDIGASKPAAIPQKPRIEIEVLISELSIEQQARFGDHVEWLDTKTNLLYTQADPAGVDADNITAAMRCTFIGEYDEEEDDFTGVTYFSQTLANGDAPVAFSKKDKQRCGFLYLRSLRTGSRALSLEHGSLLDIILRLKEIRPQMWEDTIASLASFNVASDPNLGISGVLESINASLKKYVPREWGVKPHLKVSALTREHLRKVVTAFIATGDSDHAAPFYRQGTGTINMLVLAMLSQIAEDKQNVIFAMEEVETAIPPYAQKRIVHELRQLSAQSIFTSHSPYVLEEFDLHETMILTRSNAGDLTQATISLPASVRHKRYRQEFRTRFCEGLLSRRVLIVEGATEASSFPVSARRLAELNPAIYCSLEALGICTIDAGTESQIADLGRLYMGLGKRVFGACDKQSAESKAAIEAEIEHLFMHDEKGFEGMVLKGTTKAAMDRFADSLDWPPHLQDEFPDPKADVETALSGYFRWSKGNWGTADFLAQCTEAELPQWIRDACKMLKQLCDLSPPVEHPADDLDALLG